jgi:hypothetical protein
MEAMFAGDLAESDRILWDIWDNRPTWHKITLYLESQEEYGSLHVDVHGIVDFPFDSVRDAFRKPDN